MGHLFLAQRARSVEVSHGIARLTKQLDAIAEGSELREYAMTHYLLRYAHIKGTV